MAIKEEFIEVVLSSSNIKHYENLGYPIPRTINKQGRLTVKRGTKIWVKVKDLLPDSKVKITAICENPNCPNPERILPYQAYTDICQHCYLTSKEYSLKMSGENNPMFGKESLQKGKTLEELYGEEKAKELKEENSKKMKGKPLSEEHKRKLSKARKGKKHSKETKRRMSKARKGKKHSKESIEKMKNKIITEETKRKLRVAAIERIEKAKFNGEQMMPSFNKTGCMIIEDFGKVNGFNFKTALSGKEYHIKYLGYFLDGYDSEKNVAIEIYEPFHFKNKEQIDHDIQRQKEIQDYLHCDFIIIIVDKNNNILETKIYKCER